MYHGCRRCTEHSGGALKTIGMSQEYGKTGDIIALALYDFAVSMGPQAACPCVVPGQSLCSLARLGMLAGQPER